VNEIALNANPKSPSVNFLEYTILNKDGSPSYHNNWVTDLHLEEQTVEWITRGGRARWRIENESFNTLKNQGYHPTSAMGASICRKLSSCSTSWPSSSIKSSNSPTSCTSGPEHGAVRARNTGTRSVPLFGYSYSPAGVNCWSGSIPRL
jgi:hypothetical protein